MTISEFLRHKNDDLIECVMCDDSRNVFDLMKRMTNNKMPLCLKHLEDIAPLYTISDLEMMKKSTVKKFIQNYRLLKLLCWLGLFPEDICQ